MSAVHSKEDANKSVGTLLVASIASAIEGSIYNPIGNHVLMLMNACRTQMAVTKTV